MFPNFLKHLNMRFSKEKNNSLIKNIVLGQGKIHTPLLKSKEYFPEIKKQISNATHEVLIMSYKIDANCDGENDLFEALEMLSKNRESKTKVTVRILINRRNGFANFFKPNSTSNLNNFRKTLPSRFPNLDFQYAEFNHYAFGALHQKQFIIDGKLAILPSSDCTKLHNYKNNQPSWVDIASVVESESIVNGLREDFICEWDKSSVSSFIGRKKAITSFPSLGDYKNESNSNIDIMYLSKRGNGYLHKRHYSSPYKIALIEAINYATSVIEIITPNLNDQDVIDALANANRRGVLINILTNKFQNQNSENKPFMGGDNQKAIKNLLSVIKQSKRGKAPNYDKLNIRWMTNTENKVVQESGWETMHAKYFRADNVVLAGSSNLDKQSSYHSHEADICFQSSEKAEEYHKKIFLPYFNKGINVFDTGEEIKTPFQQANLQLASLAQQCENILNTKINSLNNKEEKEEIEALNKIKLSSQELRFDFSPHTNQTQLYEKMKIYKKLLKNNFLNNKTVNMIYQKKSFLSRTFSFFKDSITNLLTQNTMLTATDLSSQNMLQTVGHEALSCIKKIEAEALLTHDRRRPN